jgi:hypothetical protein
MKQQAEGGEGRGGEGKLQTPSLLTLTEFLSVAHL